MTSLVRAIVSAYRAAVASWRLRQMRVLRLPPPLRPHIEDLEFLRAQNEHSFQVIRALQRENAMLRLASQLEPDEYPTIPILRVRTYQPR